MCVCVCVCVCSVNMCVPGVLGEGVYQKEAKLFSETIFIATCGYSNEKHAECVNKLWSLSTHAQYSNTHAATVTSHLQ